MTRKEFQKIDDAARKTVAKKYGWRQNGYLNWKVEKDYFFSFLHLEPKDASLEVKPLYFDDLWWEISGMFENEKKPPMSLRGWGCAAISSQEIAIHQLWRRCFASGSYSCAECAVGLRVGAVAGVDWGKAQSPSRQGRGYRRATVQISSDCRG